MSRPAWQDLRLNPGDREQLWELFHENSKTSQYDYPPPDEEVLSMMALMWESLPFEGYPVVELGEGATGFRAGDRAGVAWLRETCGECRFCRRGAEWTTQITTRSTLAETNAAAADFARKSKFGADGCRMVPNGLFHSGGMHTKM